MKSVSVTMPTNFPSLTTGRLETLRSRIRSIASSVGVSGVTVTGFLIMTADTETGSIVGFSLPGDHERQHPVGDDLDQLVGVVLQEDMPDRVPVHQECDEVYQLILVDREERRGHILRHRLVVRHPVASLLEPRERPFVHGPAAPLTIRAGPDQGRETLGRAAAAPVESSDRRSHAAPVVRLRMRSCTIPR